MGIDIEIPQLFCPWDWITDTCGIHQIAELPGIKPQKGIATSQQLVAAGTHIGSLPFLFHFPLSKQHVIGISGVLSVSRGKEFPETHMGGWGVVVNFTGDVKLRGFSS